MCEKIKKHGNNSKKMKCLYNLQSSIRGHRCMIKYVGDFLLRIFHKKNPFKLIENLWNTHLPHGNREEEKEEIRKRNDQLSF